MNYIPQDKEVAYMTYKYKNSVSLGLFNFESEPVKVEVNLEDGKYINLYNDQEIEINDGIITVSDIVIIEQ